jgi:hypothetical protein
LSGSQISHLNANGLVFSNNFSKVIQEILLATASVYLVPEVATPEIEKEYPSFVTGMMILHGERVSRHILLMILTVTERYIIKRGFTFK